MASLAVAALALCLVTASARERAARAAVPDSAGRSLTAWLPYWEMPAALDATLAGAAEIHVASPYWYDVRGDATVVPEPGAGSASVVARLRSHGVSVVPMVTEEAGLGEFSRTLASAAKRAALARALVAIGSRRGYAGVDIDFESFAYDPRHRAGAADRVAAAYPRLVGRVCGALRALGRVCEVAVMGRTGPGHAYAHHDIATWVYDYGALAAAAGTVQLMAYDYHSPVGSPGPIAPLGWVRRVIAYAVSQAPPGHYALGVPAYGYDWVGRGHGTPVLARQARALADSVHAPVRWDGVAGEETFSYRADGHRHTVWFEGVAADVERAHLAAAAGMSGVAVWAAGYEQPRLWPRLLAALR